MSLNRQDAQAIAATAQRLGVDPRTLGGLFELESGVDPNIWGGAGGKYKGLIQFGPGARSEVGLPDRQMSIPEQLPYVEKYFQQRGFKPGKHGTTELYRTVLVGNPGQSGTDSFGTNSDKAAKRMEPGGDLYQRFSKKFDPVWDGNASSTGSLPSVAAQSSSGLDDLFGGLMATTSKPRPEVIPALGVASLGPSSFVDAVSGRSGSRMAGSPSFVSLVSKLLDGGATGAQQPMAGSSVAQDPMAMITQPVQSSAAATTGGGDEVISLKTFGQKLQGLGFKVAENPEFGGVGKHSDKSHHYSGDAFDLTIQPGSPLLKGRPDSDWLSIKKQMGEQLRAALPNAEIFHPGYDPVGGHSSHIHLAVPGASKAGVRLNPQLRRLLSITG